MKAASARRISEESSGRLVDASRTTQSRHKVTKAAVLEWAGVEFIAENGGGAGVKLRKNGK